MSKKVTRISQLDALRIKAGLTQEQLADAIGVTDHTIRNWTKGRAMPKLTVSQVKKLCAALKISLEKLPENFGPTDEEP